MANFLLEVLSPSDAATLDGFRDALVIVNDKVKHLKNELVLSLESCFGSFDSDIYRVSSWFVEVHGVDEEASKLSEKLSTEKFAQSISTEELGFVQEEIASCSSNIQLLKGLVEVVQNLESADPSDIYTASKRLRKSKDCLSELIKEFFEFERVEWVKGLQTAIISQIYETYDLAMNEWNTKFQFEHNTLVIDPEIGKCDIANLVETLRNLNYFPKHYERFCEQFWEELLSKASTPYYTVRITLPNLKNSKKPILQTDIAVNANNSESPPESILDAAVNFGSPSTILIHVKKLDSPIVEASVVFKNIHRLLGQLSQVFAGKVEMMRTMGEILGPKLINQLSTKCLKSLILQESKGSKERARENILHLHDFKENLRDINFRMSDETTFDEFESNFDGLFMRQVREDTLAHARVLIKANIHHTTETIPYENSIHVNSNSDERSMLHNSPYLLQSYTISRSIAAMVELLQDHLENYPEDFLLISNTFNMFIGIVNIPKHDSDSKDFIPLSAVLIHNNCVFLAQHAETTFPMCEDTVPLLRSKATQAFTYMMKSIRTHLNGMISLAMASLDEETQEIKSKRRHHFQSIAVEFEKLDRIFKTVLPSRPWREALATLVDHTLNEICSKVLTCEDISANNANELADSFTKLGVETSQVFKKDGLTPREVDGIVSKLVPKWQRFRMLTFILTASMRDIQDKWVNGCGPLSFCFTAEEIRKLVRALFQNTDHRAAFLASIK